MQHFLFTNITPEMRAEIIERMGCYQIEPGDIVFNQGDPGRNFYVVSEGTLEVYINGNMVRTLVKGDNFGELALISDAPRSASIKTISNVTLWALDRGNF
jgi:CRP-like cAMP-binding protein